LGVITSGAIFQVGGAGYIVLNAANSLIQNQNFLQLRILPVLVLQRVYFYLEKFYNGITLQKLF